MRGILLTVKSQHPKDNEENGSTQITEKYMTTFVPPRGRKTAWASAPAPRPGPPRSPRRRPWGRWSRPARRGGARVSGAGVASAVGVWCRGARWRGPRSGRGSGEVGAVLTACPRSWAARAFPEPAGGRARLELRARPGAESAPALEPELGGSGGVAVDPGRECFRSAAASLDTRPSALCFCF